MRYWKVNKLEPATFITSSIGNPPYSDNVDLCLRNHNFFDQISTTTVFWFMREQLPNWRMNMIQIKCYDLMPSRSPPCLPKTLESVSNNKKYHENKSKTQIFSHLQSHQGLLDVHARSQEPKILQKAFSALFIRFLSSFHSKFSCHVTLLLFIFVLICCNNLKWSNLHEFVFLHSRI